MLKPHSINKFSIFYLFIGISGLLFFIWTGQYLLKKFPEKQQLDLSFRVMQRSRHIFLLLISLIEIGIGIYIQPVNRFFFILIQRIATSLMVCAHILFIYAFFYEIEVKWIPETPILHYATYLVLASLSIHFLTKFSTKTH